MDVEERVLSQATPEEAKDRNRRIFHYALREKRWLGLSILILLLTVGLEVIGPAIVAEILDKQLLEGKGILDQKVFVYLILAYVVVTLVGAVALYYSDLWAQKAANRITAHIRDDVFQHLQRMPISYFDTLPAGTVVSRVTSDTRALQTLYQLVLSDVMMTLVSIAVMYVTLLFMAWQVALLLIPALVVLTFVIRDYRNKSAVYSAQWRRGRSEISAAANENLQNMELIQSFDRGPWIMERFKVHVERLFEVGKKFVWLDSYNSYNLVAIIRMTTIGLIIFIFGLTVLAGKSLFSVGLLFLFIDYTTKIFNRGQNLSHRMSDLERAKAAGDHIFELLRSPVEEQPAADGMVAPEAIDIMEGPAPLIRFQDVSFAYKEGVPVLKNIDFKVERGETVAFVGATGSGKSTIMNLMQRFYDPQEGVITIAGHDLRDYNRETIRRPMAIVQQDPWLFTGTVYDNISLGRDVITMELAQRAMEEVGGSFFLRRHEKGLLTEVRQNGEDFSSGERQLISFARALAQNPQILVLDEATAHVDSETEQIIQKGIKRLQQDRTTLIIAHRLSTIRHSAEILLLDQGEIVERGTHEALMAQGGRYAQMYLDQSRRGREDQARETLELDPQTTGF